MDHISYSFKRESSGSRRARPWARGGLALLTAAWCLAPAGEPSAIGLEQLTQDSRLTPEWLLRQFADFDFRLGAQVQAPGEFLTRRSGDCDDFSALAAEVLKRKGYSPRLVVVHMDETVHVVCYVTEIRGYLDYNRRGEHNPVVPCGNRLGEIAQQVAESFQAPWRTVSEVVYEAGRPKYLATVFP